MIDEQLLAVLADRHELSEPSIAFKYLDGSGRESSLAPERIHYPASMIKLPIAMVLAAFCEAGAYRLDDPYTVEECNITANDAPSPFKTGYRATLGELARAMLSASDNVATNVLIDALGRDTITHACAAFGLRQTAVRRKLSGAEPLIEDPAATGRNSHPACDAAALLALLARDASHGPSWVYDALLEQHWNGKLSAGLRPDDRFAHKTGDTSDVSHDGGILRLPDGRRYVLVVYTSLAAVPSNDMRFAALARDLRTHLEA